ncbi:hypothetical protein OS493_024622 [Desmophyllum pertusum]|uniref:Uncharacterized protein n=1 Tax=Desmophyllum pertusum TaxID=174260 RepID=A0A9X0D1Q4_9CNID|nr:hypothetical protein OS493_024622 [Desmophyllum pertusum]
MEGALMTTTMMMMDDDSGSRGRNSRGFVLISRHRLPVMCGVPLDLSSVTAPQENQTPATGDQAMEGTTNEPYKGYRCGNGVDDAQQRGRQMTRQRKVLLRERSFARPGVPTHKNR